MSSVAGQQFLRKINLIVFGKTLEGIDLSQFRIKFSVKRSDTMTPNTADIRVYNLSQETAQQIFKNFSPGTIDRTTGFVTDRGQVLLQAGYSQNFGVIFQGNIKQIIIGRESATDTFIDIVAGDGDRAYNFAFVSTSLAKGSTYNDQIKAVTDPMAPKGVTLGPVSGLPDTKLPRGKVFFGNSKDHVRNISNATNQGWSIQNEKITFIPKNTYLPGTAVELNSNTGMIGTPQQTNEGVNVKCLLNPNILIGTAVKLNNQKIAGFKINLSVPLTQDTVAAPLNSDGLYYVLVAEHSGDTRGIEWYTSLICLNINVTSNPLNAVQPDYGR